MQNWIPPKERGGQLYFPWTKFICIAADKNNLHWYQLSTVYKIVHSSKTRKAHNTPTESAQKGVLENTYVSFEDSIFFHVYFKVFHVFPYNVKKKKRVILTTFISWVCYKIHMEEYSSTTIPKHGY